MISPFSKMMDRATEAHFKKDRSGRLVFIPFGLKRKCYFVDLKSDEEKIRALVKMYRSATTLIILLTSPCLFVPGLILDDYAGLSPRGHRLTISLGIPLFFWLVLIGLLWMLWRFYKQAIPRLTSSLIEVGPDMKGHLSENFQPPRRLLLLSLVVGLLLIVVALLAFLASYHSRM